MKFVVVQRRSLGNFDLGAPLYDTLRMIRNSALWVRDVEVTFDDVNFFSTPVVVDLRGFGIRLHFDAVYHLLHIIEVYAFDRATFTFNGQHLFPTPMSYESITAMTTFSKREVHTHSLTDPTSNVYALRYAGMTFEFRVPSHAHADTQLSTDELAGLDLLRMLLHAEYNVEDSPTPPRPSVHRMSSKRRTITSPAVAPVTAASVPPLSPPLPPQSPPSPPHSHLAIPAHNNHNGPHNTSYNNYHSGGNVPLLYPTLSPPAALPYLYFERVTATPGLGVYFWHRQAWLSFGDHVQDVISTLGAPESLYRISNTEGRVALHAEDSQMLQEGADGIYRERFVLNYFS